MRFVVLEHRQVGSVHWDFLFQQPWAGLRTWKVESCPPHLGWQTCRELPDHREVYLKYEGPITGSRGSVKRWDAGTYQPMTWRKDEVRLLIDGERMAGALELERIVGDAWQCRLARRA